MRTRRKIAEVADSGSDGEDDAPPQQVFSFNGRTYASYTDMVEAKRARNREVLTSSGLLEAKAALDASASEEKRAAAASRGLKRSKERPSRDAAPPPRRKSSRIAGAAAPGIYVEDERSGRFEIGGGSFAPEAEPEKPKFYNGRVNDGSDLTVAECVELTGPKWAKEGTAESAANFMSKTLTDVIDEMPIVASPKKRKGSPTSVARGPGGSTSDLESHLDDLSVDDVDTCVAKVTPERIYSVVCHPSPDRIIVGAGDKQGHLGIWNVDQYGATDGATDGVHLFKPHSGAVSSLAWTCSGTTLLSSSYDGTVRAFDANKQVFEEVFATYDDSPEFKDRIGYGTDRGYNSWIQSMEIDRRYESGKCFFLSTSEGGVIHVDLRSKGKVTFDQVLSDRKINSVR